jgi:hypothetical protein
MLRYNPNPGMRTTENATTVLKFTDAVSVYDIIDDVFEAASAIEHIIGKGIHVLKKYEKK